MNGNLSVEHDIILDSGSLGILLSHQNMALRHHFYHIRREEIENDVQHIKKNQKRER